MVRYADGSQGRGHLFILWGVQMADRGKAGSQQSTGAMSGKL